jgi:hypothetical protein
VASYLLAGPSELNWANLSAGNIFHCALGTTCASRKAWLNAPSPQGFAKTSTVLYWGSVTPGTGGDTVSIQSAPVSGLAVTTLCQVPSVVPAGAINDLRIVGGNLYFTYSTSVTGAANAIYTCSLSTPGGSASTFHTLGRPHGLASGETDLYWTEDVAAGSVWKCAFGTTCSAPTRLASAANPIGIAVSSTAVYWTTQSGSVFSYAKHPL